MPWDITEDFEYVVVKKEAPRVCFGSALDRVVLPTKGPSMSPFMRRLQPADYPNVGPGAHDDGRDAFYKLTHRITSLKGLGPRADRFREKHVYQPPPSELPPPKPWPQYRAPFNRSGQRKSLLKPNNYPSASDYKPNYEKRQMQFRYSFQGKKYLMCPVQIKCVPYNLDECAYCGCSCSAQGDYWMFENRFFLCRKHYNRLFKHCLSKYQGYLLADFKPIRDCFFAHAHNSCKAALKIMSSEDIIKKLRKEAYLDQYFPLRRHCER